MEKIKFLFIVITILFTGLACNFTSAGRPEPTKTIAVSTEAVESLLEKVEAAENQYKSGDAVDLILTESEINSLVAFELEKYNTIPISDFTIYLQNNQVEVYGSYTENNVALPITIIGAPEISEGGSIQFNIVSAKIGPISAPDLIVNQIQGFMDDQMVDMLTAQASEDFFVDNLVIEDGTIHIQGHVP